MEEESDSVNVVCHPDPRFPSRNLPEPLKTRIDDVAWRSGRSAASSGWGDPNLRVRRGISRTPLQGGSGIHGRRSKSHESTP